MWYNIIEIISNIYLNRVKKKIYIYIYIYIKIKKKKINKKKKKKKVFNETRTDIIYLSTHIILI